MRGTPALSLRRRPQSRKARLSAPFALREIEGERMVECHGGPSVIAAEAAIQENAAGLSVPPEALEGGTDASVAPYRLDYTGQARTMYC